MSKMSINLICLGIGYIACFCTYFIYVITKTTMMYKSEIAICWVNDA